MQPHPDFNGDRAGPARRRHWEMLTICAATLLLAGILQVRADGRVTVPGLARHPLPPSCVTQSAFGLKCPGCGMTRSFIHLAHGNWTAAWSVHRLGWLVFGAALLQVPYRLACLYRREPPFAGSRLPTWFSWTIIALLIGNWAAEIIT